MSSFRADAATCWVPLSAPSSRIAHLHSFYPTPPPSRGTPRPFTGAGGRLTVIHAAPPAVDLQRRCGIHVLAPAERPVTSPRFEYVRDPPRLKSAAAGSRMTGSSRIVISTVGQTPRGKLEATRFSQRQVGSDQRAAFARRAAFALQRSLGENGKSGASMALRLDADGRGVYASSSLVRPALSNPWSSSP